MTDYTFLVSSSTVDCEKSEGEKNYESEFGTLRGDEKWYPRNSRHCFYFISCTQQEDNHTESY